MRRTLRDGWMKDCCHWHCIEMHVQSLTILLLWWEVWYGTVSQPGAAYSLVALWICPSIANLLLLYNILNTHVFFLPVLNSMIYFHCSFCPVGWGCRKHWLHLCRGVRPPPTSVLIYDTKQSDSEVPVILELWGKQSIPSLPSLPGPLLTRSNSTW